MDLRLLLSPLHIDTSTKDAKDNDIDDDDTNVEGFGIIHSDCNGTLNTSDTSGEALLPINGTQSSTPPPSSKRKKVKKKRMRKPALSRLSSGLFRHNTKKEKKMVAGAVTPRNSTVKNRKTNYYTPFSNDNSDMTTRKRAATPSTISTTATWNTFESKELRASSSLRSNVSENEQPENKELRASSSLRSNISEMEQLENNSVASTSTNNANNVTRTSPPPVATPKLLRSSSSTQSLSAVLYNQSHRKHTLPRRRLNFSDGDTLLPVADITKNMRKNERQNQQRHKHEVKNESDNGNNETAEHGEPSWEENFFGTQFDDIKSLVESLTTTTVVESSTTTSNVPTTATETNATFDAGDFSSAETPPPTPSASMTTTAHEMNVSEKSYMDALPNDSDKENEHHKKLEEDEVSFNKLFDAQSAQHNSDSWTCPLSEAKEKLNRRFSAVTPDTATTFASSPLRSPPSSSPLTSRTITLDNRRDSLSTQTPLGNNSNSSWLSKNTWDPDFVFHLCNHAGSSEESFHIEEKTCTPTENSLVDNTNVVSPDDCIPADVDDSDSQSAGSFAAEASTNVNSSDKDDEPSSINIGNHQECTFSSSSDIGSFLTSDITVPCSNKQKDVPKMPMGIIIEKERKEKTGMTNEQELKIHKRTEGICIKSNETMVSHLTRESDVSYQIQDETNLQNTKDLDSLSDLGGQSVSELAEEMDILSDSREDELMLKRANVLDESAYSQEETNTDLDFDFATHSVNEEKNCIKTSTSVNHTDTASVTSITSSGNVQNPSVDGHVHSDGEANISACSSEHNDDCHDHSNKLVVRAEAASKNNSSVDGATLALVNISVDDCIKTHSTPVKESTKNYDDIYMNEGTSPPPNITTNSSHCGGKEHIENDAFPQEMTNEIDPISTARDTAETIAADNENKQNESSIYESSTDESSYYSDSLQLTWNNVIYGRFHKTSDNSYAIDEITSPNNNNNTEHENKIIDGRSGCSSAVPCETWDEQLPNCNIAAKGSSGADFGICSNENSNRNDNNYAINEAGRLNPSEVWLNISADDFIKIDGILINDAAAKAAVNDSSKFGEHYCSDDLSHSNNKKQSNLEQYTGIADDVNIEDDKNPSVNSVSSINQREENTCSSCVKSRDGNSPCEDPEQYSSDNILRINDQITNFVTGDIAENTSKSSDKKGIPIEGYVSSDAWLNSNKDEVVRNDEIFLPFDANAKVRLGESSGFGKRNVSANRPNWNRKRQHNSARSISDIYTGDDNSPSARSCPELRNSPKSFSKCSEIEISQGSSVQENLQGNPTQDCFESSNVSSSVDYVNFSSSMEDSALLPAIEAPTRYPTIVEDGNDSMETSPLLPNDACKLEKVTAHYTQTEDQNEATFPYNEDEFQTVQNKEFQVLSNGLNGISHSKSSSSRESMERNNSPAVWDEVLHDKLSVSCGYNSPQRDHNTKVAKKGSSNLAETNNRADGSKNCGDPEITRLQSVSSKETSTAGASRDNDAQKKVSNARNTSKSLSNSSGSMRYGKIINEISDSYADLKPLSIRSKEDLDQLLLDMQEHECLENLGAPESEHAFKSSIGDGDEDSCSSNDSLFRDLEGKMDSILPEIHGLRKSFRHLSIIFGHKKREGHTQESVGNDIAQTESVEYPLENFVAADSEVETPSVEYPLETWVTDKVAEHTLKNTTTAASNIISARAEFDESVALPHKKGLSVSAETSKTIVESGGDVDLRNELKDQPNALDSSSMAFSTNALESAMPTTASKVTDEETVDELHDLKQLEQQMDTTLRLWNRRREQMTRFEV